jgi:nitrite reductase/ring-hydroxylating ferredoxin subunit
MVGGVRVFLCKASDLAPGQVRRVDRGGAPAIAVYNIDGSFYATDDCCTHGLASLAEGTLEGDTIECNLHFGGFHVPTGKAVFAPCSIDVRTYPTETAGDDVFAIVADA